MLTERGKETKLCVRLSSKSVDNLVSEDKEDDEATDSPTLLEDGRPSDGVLLLLLLLLFETIGSVELSALTSTAGGGERVAVGEGVMSSGSMLVNTLASCPCR